MKFIFRKKSLIPSVLRSFMQSEMYRGILRMTFFFFCFFFQNMQAVAVRVLLEEEQKPNWELQSSCGFIFQDAKTGKRISNGATYHKALITVKNGKFFINGKSFNQSEIYIKPTKQHSFYQNAHYDGFFFLSKRGSSYYLINVLDSEEYVYSVLKAESWPGWPVEVNKVLAVACRSYLLHQLLTSRKKHLPYHIKNTNHHQCYKGIHSCPIIRQAVEETKGLFLSHNGQPILAMFDICCGGVIPGAIDGLIDFDKAPYLARSYACTFCKDCKSYSWEVEYSLNQLRYYLQQGVDELLHEIKDVKVVNKDGAGVVHKLIAETAQKEFVFSAQELYKLLKSVKSYAFSVKTKSKKVTLKGRGYGHHIGLCQWGARQMVAQGWSYEKILAFFYPGTTFMRLNNELEKKV